MALCLGNEAGTVFCLASCPQSCRKRLWNDICMCKHSSQYNIYIYIDYKTAAVFQAVKLKLLKGVHLSEWKGNQRSFTWSAFVAHLLTSSSASSKWRWLARIIGASTCRRMIFAMNKTQSLKDLPCRTTWAFPVSSKCSEWVPAMPASMKNPREGTDSLATVALCPWRLSLWDHSLPKWISRKTRFWWSTAKSRCAASNHKEIFSMCMSPSARL